MALAVLTLAVPAAAAGDPIQALRHGADVYKTGRYWTGVRRDLWHLSPDGRFDGNYTVQLSGYFGVEYVRTYPVHGRWWIAAGTLCVEGVGVPSTGSWWIGEGKGRACYRVAAAARGPSSKRYTAYDVKTGKSSEMFIYPRTGG